MRQNIWTSLVVMALVFTVRHLLAKSLAYGAELQRIQRLGRSVREPSSSTITSTSSPPSSSTLRSVSQSPSSSTPSSSSSQSSLPTQTLSALISLPSNSPSSMSSQSLIPYPLSSLMPYLSLLSAFSSFLLFFLLSLFPPSSSSPPSLTPSQSLPLPHSHYSSSSPPSPSISLLSFPSRSSQNSSSSALLFLHLSLPSPTSPSQVRPSSSALSKSSLHRDFVIPSSSQLPTPIHTLFSTSTSFIFHLLSSNFQLMSTTFRLLFSVFLLLFHSQLSISPVNLTLSSVTLSPSSTESSSLNSSDESTAFWNNGSLIGLELDCDDAVKYCLSFGRLLYEPTGQCFRLGSSRPCGHGYLLVLDAEALKSRRLRAVCRRKDTCDGLIMAFDGLCYNINDIRKVLCNNSATLVPYPTGLYECACYTTECLLGTASVQQPIIPGRCVLPDLNRPPMTPFRIPCSSEAINCLEFQLFFERKCCTPFTNASCPEGQWLVVDERARNLSATCVPREPCGSGSQKMHADGLCHSEEEIRDKLCPGEDLYPLANGLMQCSFKSISFYATAEGGNCVVTVGEEIVYMGGSIGGLNSNCGRNDDDQCSPETNPISSKPVITPES